MAREPAALMSQLILDEQLDLQLILPRVRRWTSAVPLVELRPNELLLDDRIPEVLLTLSKPTFVTIDQDFWDRRLCHPDYCILYFALRDDQQEQLPQMLRSLFKQKGFDTRTARMGRVARVGFRDIAYWQFATTRLKMVESPAAVRRRWQK